MHEPAESRHQADFTLLDGPEGVRAWAARNNTQSSDTFTDAMLYRNRLVSPLEIDSLLTARHTKRRVPAVRFWVAIIVLDCGCVPRLQIGQTRRLYLDKAMRLLCGLAIHASVGSSVDSGA